MPVSIYESTGKPLWKLLIDLEPDALVSLLDFAWVDDALDKSEALEILQQARQVSEEPFLKRIFGV